MLGSATTTTTAITPQVKTEAVDDTFLEPLSSPLLSPLEIKTEKSHAGLSHNHHNNNNNSIHQNQLLSNSSCSNTFLTNSESSAYLHHPVSHPGSMATSHGHGHGQQPQQHNLNGYMGCTNGLVSTQQHQSHQPHQHQQQSHQHHHHQQLQVNHNNNNYYHWPPSNHQPPGGGQMYHPKYHPPTQGGASTICTPISRLMYVPPLTPPNSDPGSPGTTLQVSDVFFKEDFPNSDLLFLPRTHPAELHPHHITTSSSSNST